MPEHIRQAIQTEIESLQREHSSLTSEYLDCLDRRVKAVAWKTHADLCKARIERLQKLLA